MGGNESPAEITLPAAAELSPQQHRFLMAYLQCRTVTEAATQSQTPLSTAWRWLKDQKFQQVLREERQSALAQASVRLAQINNRAIDYLASVLENQHVP